MQLQLAKSGDDRMKDVLDFHLVVLSVVDAWVLGAMEAMGQTADIDLSMLGALRMVRMLRLVRLVGLLRMFRKFWLIVSGFIQSLRTLTWFGMLLALVMNTFGILITLTVGHNCDQDEATLEEFRGAMSSSAPSRSRCTPSSKS